MCEKRTEGTVVQDKQKKKGDPGKKEFKETKESEKVDWRFTISEGPKVRFMKRYWCTRVNEET